MKKIIKVYSYESFNGETLYFIGIDNDGKILHREISKIEYLSYLEMIDKVFEQENNK